MTTTDVKPRELLRLSAESRGGELKAGLVLGSHRSHGESERSTLNAEWRSGLLLSAVSQVTAGVAERSSAFCLQTVDAKKLEKAEAKLKAKHERRSEKDSQKASSPL